MQVKTINKVVSSKLNEWLETIIDLKLREDVKKNLLVSGGCITSMFLNDTVNDFDIYIKDINVLLKLANYYVPNRVLDGRLREQYLREYFAEFEDTDRNIDQMMSSLDDNQSEMVVRYKNLKPDQVKLNISSFGERFKLDESDEKYRVVFLSQNAISLTDDVQIVLRFSGTAEEIHKNFDFIHATNYFTFEDGLVTNIKALESTLTKELKYQGSLYPLTSIIRMKKFLLRGWKIHAGEILKIMFQISELNLRNPEVLEEQLIGVDIAYFSKIIEILRGAPEEKINSKYLNTIIDKVFNEFEEEDEQIKK
ncbi:MULTISPECIES: hypothetical protein [Flavobacterium]|uniref:Nucleotidyl transferase AbiEii toxin, Type IV TA system n=1 Tax=Flavobacterium keumense TaxID=1306518 RepID=A0ABY8N279_9FLAO|nr:MULTISPECIES: hypothetical protein [Flavobacterium]WGK93774.1 hypothetical protein MG292_06635 [Flavobacterium keumense]